MKLKDGKGFKISRLYVGYFWPKMVHYRTGEITDYVSLSRGKNGWQFRVLWFAIGWKYRTDSTNSYHEPT